MTILGIDTSMKISSVAIAKNNAECKMQNAEINILSSLVSDGTIPHSENLLPMIDSALKSCGTELSAVECFAVTVGPGSFTGIRIGAATVKGLAFECGSCCVAVSTLDALCLSVMNNIEESFSRYIIAPLIDARRNQAYNALYLYDGGVRRKIAPDRMILITDLLNEFNTTEFASLPIFFCGDIYPDSICGTAERFRFIPHGNVAEAVCRAAATEAFIDPNDLAPRYLIKTQAEREHISLRRDMERADL